MISSQRPPPAPADAPAEPTQHERTTAMLAHVLSTFAGFIAPLVIYIAKRRESRFVAFHALQALFWHLSMFVTMFGVMIVFFVSMFVSGAMNHPFPPPGAGHAAGFPPPAVFLLMFAIWGLMMMSWFVNLGFTVYVGVQSHAGRWTRYPLVGGLVARMFGFVEALTKS